jgi:hypothetical protein
MVHAPLHDGEQWLLLSKGLAFLPNSARFLGFDDRISHRELAN